MDRIERRREHIRTVSIHEDVYSMVEVNIFKLYKILTIHSINLFTFTRHLNKKKILKKKKSCVSRCFIWMFKNKRAYPLKINGSLKPPPLARPPTHDLLWRLLCGRRYNVVNVLFLRDSTIWNNKISSNSSFVFCPFNFIKVILW